HFGPVVGALTAGGSVDHAADLFDLHGDHDRVRPALGAFEEHVLDEMRDARLLVGLMPRAAPEQEADAGRVDMVHATGNDPQSVVEGGLAIELVTVVSYHRLLFIRY